MKIVEGFDQAKKLLDRQAPKDLEYKQEPAVRQIINDVRQRGDNALFELTEKFDSAKLTTLEVNKAQIKAAYKKVDVKLVDAMKLAAERIGTFHQAQKERALPTYTHGKTGAQPKYASRFHRIRTPIARNTGTSALNSA